MQYDARLGPDRAPWRMLWLFIVARAGSISRNWDPPRRAAQDVGNPHNFLSNVKQQNKHASDHSSQRTAREEEHSKQAPRQSQVHY